MSSGQLQSGLFGGHKFETRQNNSSLTNIQVGSRPPAATRAPGLWSSFVERVYQYVPKSELLLGRGSSTLLYSMYEYIYVLVFAFGHPAGSTLPLFGFSHRRTFTEYQHTLRLSSGEPTLYATRKLGCISALYRGHWRVPVMPCPLLRWQCLLYIHSDLVLTE